MWFVLFIRCDLELLVKLHADEVGASPTLTDLEALGRKKLDRELGMLPVTLEFIDAYTERPR